MTGTNKNVNERMTGQKPGWLRRAMAISVLEGGFATFYLMLTTGAFLTGYALMLGANDFQLGLLAAIPFLAQVFQLPAAFLTELTGKRKAVAVITTGASRFSYLALVFLPFLGFIYGGWKVAALITFVGFAAALATAGVNAWTSWMSDLIPERIRGRYFANRSLALSLVTIATSLGGGRLLDWFRANGMEVQGFTWIFGGAVVLGLVSVVLLLFQSAPRMKLVRGKRFFKRITEPIRDRNYRRVLGFFILFYVGIGFSMGFFAPHMIKNLEMSYLQISLFSGIVSLTAMGAYRIWGRIIDRAGNRSVLIASVLMIFMLPIFWLIPSKELMWPIWPLAVLAGISWSGFNLSAFNLPMATSPRENRSYYLAMHGIVTGLAIFAASTTAGAIAQAIRGFEFSVGPVHLVNYHVLFFASGLIRLSSLLFARRIEETGDIGVIEMVHLIRGAVRQRVVSRFHTIPAMAAKILPERVVKVVRKRNGKDR